MVHVLVRSAGGVLASLLLVACGGPAINAAPAASGALQKINLVDCCISGTEIGMWVAYDQHLFQQNGLDPQLVTVPPPTDIVATQTGEIDIGTAPGSAINAYASGSDNIVFVAGNVSKPVYFLMAPSHITSIAQLKGAKVGISGLFAPPDVALRNALAKQYRLDAGKDYEVVPFRAIQDVLPALGSGVIQAGVLSSPLYLQAQKIGMHVLLSLSVTLPEANAWILANRTFARRHPDLVLAFLRSFIEGIHLARTHPDVAIASIVRHSQDPDPVDAKTTYKDYIGKFDINMYPEALAPYQEYTSNAAAKSMRLNDILDYSFLRQLNASGFLKAHGMTLQLPQGTP